MEPKNWRQIETIFHTALEMNEEERSRYLLLACAKDEKLHNEVESLLTAFDEESGFMDEPVLEDGFKVLHQDTGKNLSGQTIGIYQIKRKLGGGGMGDVYLAEDLRLNRAVALKFISSSLPDDNWAKKQLVREAQAVAMLEHPNICAVHGIEEIGEHRFIVMQYVQGETLSHLIRTNSIKPEQILPIARQIVEALASAHAHGILHRDIKPGNIVMTPEGQIKVLDFGLAKFVHEKNKFEKTGFDISHASYPGLILGTIAYMSPEQLRAEKLDFRSDIFSLGTVLFELSANSHPFAQNCEAETIAAILNDEPESNTLSNSLITFGFKRVIKKCLEKNKELRYQSASELLLELSVIEDAKRPKIAFSAYRNYALVFLLILSLAIGLFFHFRNQGTKNVAVLPFINQTEDSSLDYLSDGMAESLIIRLSGSDKLRVKTFTAVSGYKEKGLDPAQVGRRLGVDAVIIGNLAKKDNQFILQTKLINTSDGSQIWSADTGFQASELPSLQNDVSGRVISALLPLDNQSAVNVTGDNRAANTGQRAENGEAFRYYLIGRYYWKKRDRENLQKAIANFNRAIEIDPVYARAYAGLADSYVLLSSVAYGSIPTKEAMNKAKAAAKQALEIDDNLCESHTSLGVVLVKFDWNWTEAEREFRRAIEINPEYAPAHYWYSNLLAITGRGGEAVRHGITAAELDPFSPLVDINLGRLYYYAGKYDDAFQLLSEKSAANPGDLKTQYMLGLVYLQQQKYAEAENIFEKIYAASRPLGIAALGYTYAKIGKKKEATELLDEIDHIAAQTYIPPQEKALIYVGLDDKEKALLYLEKAWQEKHGSLISIKVEPLFASLRSDARFIKLLQQMNL
ncbi:MAG: protein kinase [Acidobacteriota bacterium]|nr:protein kinase [Acidobacteriota bacterium]